METKEIKKENKGFEFNIGDIISNKHGTFTFKVIGYDGDTSYQLHSNSTAINRLPKAFVESNFKKDILATMRENSITKITNT